MAEKEAEKEAEKHGLPASDPQGRTLAPVPWAGIMPGRGLRTKSIWKRGPCSTSRG